MPSFPPRITPIKKNEEEESRTHELYLALRNKNSEEKIAKAVEKLRKAKLSLLKAKIHEIEDNFFKNQLNNQYIEELKEITAKKISDVEQEILNWQNKGHQEIINTVKTKYGI
jgi:hypothetical protein